jgi:hypothetical protein
VRAVKAAFPNRKPRPDSSADTAGSAPARTASGADGARLHKSRIFAVLPRGRGSHIGVSMRSGHPMRPPRTAPGRASATARWSASVRCGKRGSGPTSDDWAVMAPRSRRGLAQTLLPYAWAVLHVRSMHPPAMASFVEVRVALVQAARDAGRPVDGSLAWQDANLHVAPLLLSLFGKPGAPGQIQRWLGRHGLNLRLAARLSP